MVVMSDKQWCAFSVPIMFACIKISVSINHAFLAGSKSALARSLTRLEQARMTVSSAFLGAMSSIMRVILRAMMALSSGASVPHSISSTPSSSASASAWCSIQDQ